MKMIRMTAAFLALIFVFLLVSCSSNPGIEIVLTDDVNTGVSDSRSDVYYFDTGKVKLAPHDNFTSVSAYLGEPVSSAESPSCAYIGYDKVFVYSGYTVQTYPENGIDYVLWISLDNPSVKTAEGVGIGSTRDQVTSATGVGYEDRNSSLVYTKGKTSLAFVLTDGKVSAVQYLAN